MEESGEDADIALTQALLAAFPPAQPPTPELAAAVASAAAPVLAAAATAPPSMYEADGPLGAPPAGGVLGALAGTSQLRVAVLPNATLRFSGARRTGSAGADDPPALGAPEASRRAYVRPAAMPDVMTALLARGRASSALRNATVADIAASLRGLVDTVANQARAQAAVRAAARPGDGPTLLGLPMLGSGLVQALDAAAGSSARTGSLRLGAGNATAAPGNNTEPATAALLHSALNGTGAGATQTGTLRAAVRAMAVEPAPAPAADGPGYSPGYSAGYSAGYRPLRAAAVPTLGSAAGLLLPRAAANATSPEPSNSTAAAAPLRAAAGWSQRVRDMDSAPQPILSAFLEGVGHGLSGRRLLRTRRAGGAT